MQTQTPDSRAHAGGVAGKILAIIDSPDVPRHKQLHWDWSKSVNQDAEAEERGSRKGVLDVFDGREDVCRLAGHVSDLHSRDERR